jgi:transposase
MPRTRPAYPAEFRRQMVELVRAGRSPDELAKEFEPSGHSIRQWVRLAEQDDGRPGDGLSNDEREELKRLRREVRQLRQEREILANGSKGAPCLWLEKLRAYSRRGARRAAGSFVVANGPVGKRGPGTIADLRVATPPGDPV